MKKNIFAIILSMILIFSLPTTMAVKAYELPAYVSNSYENYNQSTADYNFFQVRRSRSRSHSRYRSHSASSNSIDLAIYCIAGLIVLVSTFITFKINKKKSTKIYKNIPPIFPHNANMQIAKYIYKKDENFNLEKFLNWVKNIFLTLENAFSQRDWQKIFTFESKELLRSIMLRYKSLLALEE